MRTHLRLIAMACGLSIPALAQAESLAQMIERGVPQPRGRPDVTANAFVAAVPKSVPARAIEEAVTGASVENSLFKAALDAVSADRYDEARALKRKLVDPLDRKIVDWLIVQAPNSRTPSREIVVTMPELRGWPRPERTRLRAETAFSKERPPASDVLVFYSREMPTTIAGKLQLAGALMETGKPEDATQIIRPIWHEENLDKGSEDFVISRFGKLLTQTDHKRRADQMLYDRRNAAALRAKRKLTDRAERMLVDARIEANKKSKAADRELAALPDEVKRDPGYAFARAQRALARGKEMEAAQILISTTRNPERLVDPDAWWDLRHTVSRRMLDLGRDDLAYRVAAEHSAQSDGDIVDAEFNAGWYALRFLKDAERAQPHFERVRSVATLPRTISRANYWVGRAEQAKGNEDAARAAYKQAARQGTTYYGQLARAALGDNSTGAESLPEITERDRQSYNANPLVRAVDRLAAAGHDHRTPIFLRQLAHTLETPGELHLAVEHAKRLNHDVTALYIGKTAEKRGLDVGGLAFPLDAIPQAVDLPGDVDRALVYAISRQESAFNKNAVSHVGARGLMQLMPATAGEMARRVKVGYSKSRLTSDPGYNVKLGAAYLDQQLGRTNGSYVMTFAGYNAGPSRAKDWAVRYGDPRGTADPVDWVERIPFDETRDYVQKVMENLQVYRSRLGNPLSIHEDLTKGNPA